MKKKKSTIKSHNPYIKYDAVSRSVKSVREPKTDKFLKQVYVKGKGTYNYNSAWKVYNNTANYEQLKIEQVKDLDYAKSSTKMGKGGGVKKDKPKEIKKRLEHLRKELRAERISYGELAELQSLGKYIDPSDVELLEAAGVEEKFVSGGSMAKGGVVWEYKNKSLGEISQIVKMKAEKYKEKGIHWEQGGKFKVGEIVAIDVDYLKDAYNNVPQKVSDKGVIMYSIGNKSNVIVDGIVYSDFKNKFINPEGGSMEKGGKVGIISYQKHWSPDGTVYDQTVKIDRKTFENLKDAVHAEIAMNYPRKDEYVWTSGYETYLEPLSVSQGGIVYLNHTQTRFSNLFLKLPLKDRNTRLKIVGKLAEGGKLPGSFTWGNPLLDVIFGNCKSVKTMQAGGEVQKFQDLILQPVTHGLKIKLTKEGKEEAKELREAGKSDVDIFYDFFDDVQGNSEFLFHGDLGESGFGLTNAPGITDGYYYEGDDIHNLYKTDYPESAKVYYYGDYMLKDMIDELLEKGEIVLNKAEEMAKGGKIKRIFSGKEFQLHKAYGTMIDARRDKEILEAAGYSTRFTSRGPTSSGTYLYKRKK